MIEANKPRSHSEARAVILQARLDDEMDFNRPAMAWLREHLAPLASWMITRDPEINPLASKIVSAIGIVTEKGLFWMDPFRYR